MNAIAIFLAALGPMLTVVALRRLLESGAGATPAEMHVFVALGMVGSALGAPLLATFADRRGAHLRIAAALALVDAVVSYATSTRPSTELLFVLRPIHGAATMGLLALLFATLSGGARGLIARGGVPMIAALAIGPGVGGALARRGAGLPFRMEAFLSLCLAVGLAVAASRATTRPAPRPVAGAALGACKALAAPLVMTALQRFAIGGLVVAFAVRARSVYGFGDPAIGACFSLVLVVFAVVVFALARVPADRQTRSCPAFGGLLFGVALMVLAAGPRWSVVPALVQCGIGAALVYAPALALTSVFAPKEGRAATMALLHSAGALGMILGPVVAALLDVALRSKAAPTRSAAFLVVAGALQLVFALGLAPRFRALARGLRVRPEQIAPSTTEGNLAR